MHLPYDLAIDNPRNPNMIGLSRREFARLFAGCQVKVRRTTLAAPLARWLAPNSWAATLLAWLSPLQIHFAATVAR